MRTMVYPKGYVGIILAAIIAVLITSIILLLILLIYMKRKKPNNGYSRMSSSSSLEARRDSRCSSIFSTHGLLSIHENGKAHDFDIPLIDKKATGAAMKTCQLHFSLFYNFHSNELIIQVIQARNLPKLFGLQSGVLVKVSLLDGAGETKEQLGNTSIHYRQNSVFNSLFSCQDIASVDLQMLGINMSLYSQDRFGQSHFVGGVIMKFDEVTFDPSTPVYFWRPVQRKNNGSKSENHSRGTYVIVTLLRNGKVLEKKRTQPCKGGLDPVWNEPFVFDWKNGDKDETGYKFVFEVKNSEIVLPDALLGVVEICKHDSDHWKEMMEKKNYARAMCHNIT